MDEINACISALQTFLTMPYEILISSNSCYSKDEQRDIKKNAPLNVKWIFNAKTGGFAYAMNKGLKVARGEYSVIMNSDCLLTSPIDELLTFMDKHPDVGAVAPQMKDAEGIIQDTARPYVSLPRFFVRQMQRILFHKVCVMNPSMDYSRVQTVDWVIGAFVIVSRKAYEATHGLDDTFFMYAEDLDWCTRIRQKGLEVVYYPKIVITYKGTRRARKNAGYAKIFMKSHVAFWKKFGYFYGYPKRRKILYD